MVLKSFGNKCKGHNQESEHRLRSAMFEGDWL